MKPKKILSSFIFILTAVIGIHGENEFSVEQVGEETLVPFEPPSDFNSPFDHITSLTKIVTQLIRDVEVLKSDTNEISHVLTSLEFMQKYDPKIKRLQKEMTILRSEGEKTAEKLKREIPDSFSASLQLYAKQFCCQEHSVEIKPSENDLNIPYIIESIRQFQQEKIQLQTNREEISEILNEIKQERLLLKKDAEHFARLQQLKPNQLVDEYSKSEKKIAEPVRVKNQWVLEKKNEAELAQQIEQLKSQVQKIQTDLKNRPEKIDIQKVYDDLQFEKNKIKNTNLENKREFEKLKDNQDKQTDRIEEKIKNVTDDLIVQKEVTENRIYNTTTTCLSMNNATERKLESLKIQIQKNMDSKLNDTTTTCFSMNNATDKKLDSVKIQIQKDMDSKLDDTTATCFSMNNATDKKLDNIKNQVTVMIKNERETTDQQLCDAKTEMDAKLENSNTKINDCYTKMDKANLVMGAKIFDMKHQVAEIIKKERETTDGQLDDITTELDTKVDNSITKIDYCYTKIDKLNLVMGSKIFDLETKLPELIGNIVIKHLATKKIIGFSAFRQPAYGNSCGDHTVTYTSATTNTDNMLPLSTGIFTVSRPGTYLLSFLAMSTYDSKQTGVHMLKKSTTNSALLATDAQKGPTPLSMLRLVKLNKNDQVSVWFWSESPTRGCLYSGINNQTVVTTFSAILMNDSVN